MNISAILVIMFITLVTITILIELSKEKESLSVLLYRERALINLKYENISIKYLSSSRPGRSGKYDVSVTYYNPGEKRIIILFPKEEESPAKLREAVNYIKNNATNFP